jgi:hypothetical protein
MTQNKMVELGTGIHEEERKELVGNEKERL